MPFSTDRLFSTALRQNRKRCKKILASRLFSTTSASYCKQALQHYYCNHRSQYDSLSYSVSAGCAALLLPKNNEKR